MANTNQVSNAIVYDKTGKLVSAGTTALTTNADVVNLAVSANFGPVTLFTAPVTGMYNISYYIVNMATGGGSDAVGQLVFNYSDPSGSNAIYANMPSGINATLLGNGSAPLLLTAGSAITYTLGSGIFATSLVMAIAVNIQQI